MKSREKAHTIYDIADRAGVSASTVSRVLTGKVKVRQDKVDRIRSVMEELDFQPNLAARNLQTRESKSLGLILPDISNPFFSEFSVELERIALAKGYTMFISNTMNNAVPACQDMESLCIQSLLARQVDGIFFMGGRINARRNSRDKVDEMNRTSARIPLILVNGKMNGVDSYVVKTDEQAGFVELLEYMISLGHRRIAFLGGKKEVLPSDNKLKAFYEVLSRNEIPVREQWVRPGDFSIEFGERMIADLLRLGELPSAVMCINDLVAFGVLNGAVRAGVRVPEDMSVCGFDDISLAPHLYPSLTSVSHDFPSLAESAMTAFLRLRDGEKVPRVQNLPMNVRYRESHGIPSETSD